MTFVKYDGMSKQEWLASSKGRAWLERKIAEKNASRRDPGPKPPELRRTKFPFTATINGQPMLVERFVGAILTTPIEERADSLDEEVVALGWNGVRSDKTLRRRGR